MTCTCFEAGRNDLCEVHGQTAGNVQREGFRNDRIVACCQCGATQIVQAGALEIVTVICSLCCIEASARPPLALVP